MSNAQNNNQPELVALNLSNRNITNLEEVLSQIQNKELIQELDLSGNMMTSLPQNLSSFQNLQVVDLSGNSFQNYKDIANSLGTLPNLINLNIDLEIEDDALIILESLPNLIFLNGKSTKENREEEEKEFEENDTENNSQGVQSNDKGIPECDVKNESDSNEAKPMTLLEKITSQNMLNNNNSNNMMNSNTNSNKQSIPPLQISNEAVLPIDIVNDSKYENEMKNLDELLNHEDVKGESLETEIPKFQAIVQKIVANYKTQRDKIDAFYKDFQMELNEQVAKINSLIETPISNYIYSINICYSKIKIYTFLKNKVYPLFQNQKLISNASNILNLLLEIEKNINQNETAIYNLISNAAPKIDNGIKLLKDKNAEYKENIRILNSKIGTLNNELQNKNEEIKDLRKNLNKLNYENSTQKELNAKLKEENQIMTNRIISTAKKIQTTDSDRSRHVNREQEGNPSGQENLYIKQIAKQSDLSTPIGQVHTKVISKKALLEIINDIYKSKDIQDKKNSNNHLPRETLEQHMYNYLNHKYGLKRLIIEWALGIINSVKLYAKENSEICLFGKILRNELEESTIKIMQKMKTAMDELIKIYLSEIFPAKDKSEINSIFITYKNNQVYLEQRIWQYIVGMLYCNNKKDYDILTQTIENYIRSKIECNFPEEGFEKKRRIKKEEKEMMEQIKAENKILYRDLFEIILSFQIKVRSKYMKNFIVIFRSVDTDLNGIITIPQFREFCKACQIFNEEEEENIENLADDLDPYGHNIVTFSEVVEEFEKIEFDNGLSALDKISVMKKE